MDGTSSESFLIATLILAVLKIWVPLPENELYIQWYGTASVSSVRFAFRLLHMNEYLTDFAEPEFQQIKCTSVLKLSKWMFRIERTLESDTASAII